MLIRLKEVTVCAQPQGKTKAGRLGGWLNRGTGSGRQPVFLLDNITGEFGCGVNCILGPNGSGKSTLLRLLAGLLRPESGAMLVDGQVADGASLRRRIGYLPQTYGFYPKFTARETLHYIALLKGIVDRQTREECVEAILQQTGLAALAGRRVGEYSRGMRQKIGIAQALVGDPSVLLLDEPTAGLDPEERNKLRGLLVKLGQQRVIIWATSLITDAGCADRILILNTGACGFWGSSAELAACAGLGRAGFSGEETVDYECWSAMLEGGYRAILADGGE